MPKKIIEDADVNELKNLSGTSGPSCWLKEWWFYKKEAGHEKWHSRLLARLSPGDQGHVWFIHWAEALITDPSPEISSAWRECLAEVPTRLDLKIKPALSPRALSQLQSFWRMRNQADRRKLEERLKLGPDEKGLKGSSGLETIEKLSLLFQGFFTKDRHSPEPLMLLQYCLATEKLSLQEAFMVYVYVDARREELSSRMIKGVIRGAMASAAESLLGGLVIKGLMSLAPFSPPVISTVTDAARNVICDVAGEHVADKALALLWEMADNTKMSLWDFYTKWRAITHDSRHTVSAS